MMRNFEEAREERRKLYETMVGSNPDNEEFFLARMCKGQILIDGLIAAGMTKLPNVITPDVVAAFAAEIALVAAITAIGSVRGSSEIQLAERQELIDLLGRFIDLSSATLKEKSRENIRRN